jgi:serine/threonine protein kinase
VDHEPEPSPDETGDKPTEPAAHSHAAVTGGHAPERLGHYRIGETLGWGGMGIVYAAVDERTGGEVAVQLLRFSDPEGVSLRRFQQEAEATRRLNHPNIVGLREVGREGSYDYYAMDLVRGRDVAT